MNTGIGIERIGPLLKECNKETKQNKTPCFKVIHFGMYQHVCLFIENKCMLLFPGSRVLKHFKILIKTISNNKMLQQNNAFRK